MTIASTRSGEVVSILGPFGAERAIPGSFKGAPTERAKAASPRSIPKSPAQTAERSNVVVRHHLTIVAALAFVVLNVAATAAASTRVTVPANTPIAFHVLAAIDTHENHVGDVVPIETIGDTIIDGRVAVPDGSKGTCAVSKAEQPGGHGHPGSIELTCAYVVSADHGRIRLTDDAIREEGEKKRGVATVAGVLTYGLASNADSRQRGLD